MRPTTRRYHGSRGSGSDTIANVSAQVGSWHLGCVPACDHGAASVVPLHSRSWTGVKVACSRAGPEDATVLSSELGGVFTPSDLELAPRDACWRIVVDAAPLRAFSGRTLAPGEGLESAGRRGQPIRDLSSAKDPGAAQVVSRRPLAYIPRHA